MYLAEKQTRDAKVFKELITFASSLVLKDQSAAELYESSKSIMYANSYISAIDGTMQIENGSPVFTSSELKEYNAVPDAPAYFVDCFRRNTLYIGLSDSRLKEVSEASFNTNYSNDSALYRGNVYEANLYYRMLYSKYACDPYDARLAEDFSIIAYNVNTVTSNISLDRFNKIFDECKTLFKRVMYNKSFESTQPYRSLVNFFLVTMTVIRYQDEALSDLLLYKNYTSKDIKNLFYSFGFFNDSIIPAAFKEDVAKSLYKLINAKATDEAFRIILEDIFKSDSIKLSKYVLVKSARDTEYLDNLLNPDAPYIAPSTDNIELLFYKIPYEVTNNVEYIETHADDLTPISFEEMIEEDRFWFPDFDKNIPRQIEEMKKQIIDLKFGAIDTKYLSVTFKNSDLIKTSEKIALFFAMLHHTNDSAMTLESQVMKSEVSIFDLMIAFVYTRAILITKGNPANIAVGDFYSTNPNSNNRYFRHFLMMLSDVIKPQPKFEELFLYEFSEHKVTNRMTNSGGSEAKLASVIAAVQDAGNLSSEEFPSKHEFSDLVSLSDLIEKFKRISEYIDDSKYAIKHVEQGLDYYSPEYTIKDNGNIIGIDYNILKEDNNHLLLIRNDRDREANPDIIREISSENPDFVKHGIDGAAVGYYNRNKTFGLNNFFELKNAQYINEALISSETDISNQKYGGEDTFLKYLAANHPEFTSRIQKILEEEDDALEEVEAISASIAAEIDAVFRKYSYQDISFGSLDSLAVAVFASSLIGFIKSITMQIRSSSDNTLEVEIDEGSEEKITMMDGLIFEDKQQRAYHDGSDLEDALNAVSSKVVLHDSPMLGNFENDNAKYFLENRNTPTLSDLINSPIGDSTVARVDRLYNPSYSDEEVDDATEFSAILSPKEELFAHVTNSYPEAILIGGFKAKQYRLAGYVSNRILYEAPVFTEPFRHEDVI